MESPNESFGILSVCVRTADGALPVVGARITVRSEEDGTENAVFTVLYSGAGGIAENCYLPAPPKENAMRPDGGIPYRFYSIETDREGYYGVRHLHVPIYAGVTAIQPVDLVPLALGLSPQSPSSDTERYSEHTVPDL